MYNTKQSHSRNHITLLSFQLTDCKIDMSVLWNIILICVAFFMLWNICLMMRRCVVFFYAAFV